MDCRFRMEGLLRDLTTETKNGFRKFYLRTSSPEVELLDSFSHTLCPRWVSVFFFDQLFSAMDLGLG